MSHVRVHNAVDTVSHRDAQHGKVYLIRSYQHLIRSISELLPSSCDTWGIYFCLAKPSVEAAVQGRLDAGSLQCCKCWRRSWALCHVSGSLLCLLCGMSTDTRYRSCVYALVASNVSAHDAKDNNLLLLMTPGDLFVYISAQPKRCMHPHRRHPLAESTLAYPKVLSAAHGQVRRRLCLQLQAGRL